MASESQLRRLALQLERLSADGDWHALGELDRELATLLRKERRPWTPAERAALDELRRAHDAARERCEGETTRIAARLSWMREHKEGWMAYAMSNELDEERA